MVVVERAEVGVELVVEFAHASHEVLELLGEGHRILADLPFELVGVNGVDRDGARSGQVVVEADSSP